MHFHHHIKISKYSITEDAVLRSCDAVYTTQKQTPVLQRNIPPPSSALKTETVSFSETFVSTYKSTWGHDNKNIVILRAVRTSNLTWYMNN